MRRFAGTRSSRLAIVLAGVMTAACGSPATSPSSAQSAAGDAVGSVEPSASAGPSATEAALQHGFENGDTVTLVIPTSPGGGYDTQGRLLQPFLEESLRKVTGTDLRVVVQNIEGAQQRSGTEEVYRSDPDGRTIVLFSGQIVASHQVFEGAELDLSQMTPLAGYHGDTQSIVVRKDLGLPELTLEALVERSHQEPILLAHPGTQINWQILQILLRDGGWDLKTDLVAVNGTSEVVASVLRGDTQAGWTTSTSLRTAVDGEDSLQMLVNTGCKESVGDPGTPTIVDQEVPNAELICPVLGGSHTRFIMGPPDMPEGTTAALTRALEIAMDDPEHLALSEEAGHDGSFVSPDSVFDQLQVLLDLYEEYGPQIDPGG